MVSMCHTNIQDLRDSISQNLNIAQTSMRDMFSLMVSQKLFHIHKRVSIATKTTALLKVLADQVLPPQELLRVNKDTYHINIPMMVQLPTLSIAQTLMRE